VSGTPSASGTLVQLKPARELDLGTMFTAALSTGIASTAGAHLSAPFSWTFTTRHYGSELAISSATMASSPRVGVDAAGNAIAVWSDSASAVWANRYSHALLAWGGAIRIDAGTATSAYPPRIAMDQNGDALVIWAQNTTASTRLDVYSASFKASAQMWSPATLVEKITAGDAIGPVLAGDGVGNAIALWNQNDGTGIYTLWTNRHSATGWSTAPLQVESMHVGNGASYDIALDGSGNATVVWTGQTPTASRLPAASTIWSATQLHNVMGATQPRIVSTASGSLTAIWTEPSGAQYAAWAARFTGGSWGPATSIQSTSTATASMPTLATDSQGNAIAMWTSTSGTSGIFSNTYLASGGWQGEKTMTGSQSAVAISPNGHAAAVWLSGVTVQGGAGAVNANAATGWSLLPLEQPITMPADRPQLGINDSGDGFAVWTESDGKVWANRFR
jgi:hypothetical protein